MQTAWRPDVALSRTDASGLHRGSSFWVPNLVRTRVAAPRNSDALQASAMKGWPMKLRPRRTTVTFFESRGLTLDARRYLRRIPVIRSRWCDSSPRHVHVAAAIRRDAPRGERYDRAASAGFETSGIWHRPAAASNVVHFHAQTGGRPDRRPGPAVAPSQPGAAWYLARSSQQS